MSSIKIDKPDKRKFSDVSGAIRFHKWFCSSQRLRENSVLSTGERQNPASSNNSKSAAPITIAASIFLAVSVKRDEGQQIASARAVPERMNKMAVAGFIATTFGKSRFNGSSPKDRSEER